MIEDKVFNKIARDKTKEIFRVLLTVETPLIVAIIRGIIKQAMLEYAIREIDKAVKNRVNYGHRRRKTEAVVEQQMNLAHKNEVISEIASHSDELDPQPDIDKE